MGTIVAGKIESGRVRKNQSLVVMPNKKLCEVSGIFSEQDEEMKAAVCGDNVRLRLKGVEEDVRFPYTEIRAFRSFISCYRKSLLGPYSATPRTPSRW